MGTQRPLRPSLGGGRFQETRTVGFMFTSLVITSLLGSLLAACPLSHSLFLAWFSLLPRWGSPWTEELTSGL